MIQSTIVDEYGKAKVSFYETEHLEHEAVFAMALIERWGLVFGIDDGEDSAGRQKGRLATPEELIERAFAVAKLAMATARDGGLVHVAPSLEEIERVNAEVASEKAARKELRQ